MAVQRAEAWTALEMLIAVSKAMIQKMNDDCEIAQVGSSAMQGMLESQALMVEVIRGPMRKRHQLSGHAWLIPVGLGCLMISFC